MVETAVAVGGRAGSGRLARTVMPPYGPRLIANIDPDSRPEPAVLVTLEEA
ncbi:hypothetical protein ACFV8Z_09820 [Streptomyces sp. NPDC059837]|uniref:hypothetical protein n=1 Tax=Streptomyces sp. NPDC059837 TaxID=3346968 RepID=UPI00364B9A2D